ncbi:hypothetical protein ACFRFH_12120 [Leifsonia sp. NPDC056824]|uniref:hypothetical protein n=1 Tax=Leifsonia sp. NPDC056824 TaxID=3345953 RepID=UPI00367921EF
MSQIASAAPALKDALVVATKNMFQSDPHVLVTFGHPGNASNDDLICWLGIRTQQVEGPVGPLRARDETVEIDVFISSVVVGDDDQAASDRAYFLLGQIENYTRTTDTTLGGKCLWCFLTATSSKGATEPANLPSGRQIDIIATFTARVRITN